MSIVLLSSPLPNAAHANAYANKVTHPHPVLSTTSSSTTPQQPPVSYPSPSPPNSSSFPDNSSPYSTSTAPSFPQPPQTPPPPQLQNYPGEDNFPQNPPEHAFPPPNPGERTPQVYSALYSYSAEKRTDFRGVFCRHFLPTPPISHRPLREWCARGFGGAMRGSYWSVCHALGGGALRRCVRCVLGVGIGVGVVILRLWVGWRGRRRRIRWRWMGRLGSPGPLGSPFRG
jgi:hypothetical protein